MSVARPYRTTLMHVIDPKYAGYIGGGGGRIKTDGYKHITAPDYAGNIAAICLASQLYKARAYSPSNTGIPGNLIASFINTTAYVSLQQIYNTINLTADPFSRHLVIALSTIIGTVYYYSYCDPRSFAEFES